MGCPLTKVEAGKLFAVVGFVPGALGEYLNSLRQQLAPGCPFKSHVTLLPPRVLDRSPVELSRILAHRLASIEPFEIGLGRVEVFPATGVIYLGIESGSDVLQRIHDVLAEDEFAYQETYSFHPHVTLAQDSPSIHPDELLEYARLSWKFWQGERSFFVERLSFVQGLDLSTWETLSEHDLKHSRRLRTV